MKTIAPLVALIMLSLSACKKDNRFVLHAEMTGLSDKPILVIYDDPVSRLDTIFPKKASSNMLSFQTPSPFSGLLPQKEK